MPLLARTDPIACLDNPHCLPGQYPLLARTTPIACLDTDGSQPALQSRFFALKALKTFKENKENKVFESFGGLKGLRPNAMQMSVLFSPHF